MNPAVFANYVADNPHRNAYSRPFLLAGSHDRRIQNHLASSYPSPPTRQSVSLPQPPPNMTIDQVTLCKVDSLAYLWNALQ
jgi:hypothetical protein